MPVQATLPAGIHTVWSALTHPTPLARWSGRSSPLNGVRDPSERPLFEVQEPFERLEVRWPTSRGSVLDEIVLEEIDDRTTSLTWALFGDPPVRSYDLSDVAYVRAWMLRDALVGRPWADTLDYAAPIRGSVNRSMVIRAPLERVWVALTTVEDVARWLSGREGEIELEEGGNFDSGWRSDRGEQVGPGTVLAIEPPHRLAVDWSIPDHDPGPSTLQLTLDPTPFGTRVSLSHGPWDPNWDACGYALGWWCRLLNLRGICEEPPWPVRPDRAVQPTPENGIG